MFQLTSYLMKVMAEWFLSRRINIRATVGGSVGLPLYFWVSFVETSIAFSWLAINRD